MVTMTFDDMQEADELAVILLTSTNQDELMAALHRLHHICKKEFASEDLIKKKFHTVIMQGLSIHATMPEVVKTACRILRKLDIFQNKYKHEVIHWGEDWLSLLAKVVRDSPADADVQSEVICLIIGLADNDLIRHQCFVLDLHLHVLEVMDRFPEEEFLQEVSLEGLAVLGGAAGGSDILNSEGAAERVIKSLKRFYNKANIQKKGLHVIQILARKELLVSAKICQELVSIIRSVQKSFPESLIIQKEATVAMQILAEIQSEVASRDEGINVAELFVQEGCHELLFEILQNPDSDQRLQDLAGECLCVLGLERNLKSHMLLTACSKGLFTVAECLTELGADVCIGQGSETPLYFAVSYRNKNMVDLLLQHEVKDIQPSLTLSLAQGYHEITGKLLSHMGQDTESGQVVWSGLGLDNIRPEWILPTFYGQIRTHCSSAATKKLVTKIRHSEQKRYIRLQNTDSCSEIFSYKCFRFPTGSEELKSISHDSSLSFEFSSDEFEDWQQTTLTGANIPFNRGDPRHQGVSKMAEFITPEVNDEMTTENDLPAHIPEEVETCPPDISSTTMTHLDISANHISDLQYFVNGGVDVLQIFAQLERLNLSCNDLQNLPVELVKELKSLRNLDLSSNKLTEFPVALDVCSQLVSLNLSSNMVSSISFDTIKCPQLEELNLSKNKLTTFPVGLDRAFPCLHKLDIRSNRIQVLPSEPCDLTSLCFLDMSQNSIQILPDEFLKNCPKLETLRLVDCGIELLSCESTAACLTRLSVLDLSSNDITEKEPFFVPRFILKLPNVQRVDLSGNGLTGIPPPCMWKTQKLRQLILSKNNITKINLEGAHLWNKLEKLHLSHNSFSELPREIGQLSSLQSLDVSHNKYLTSLPDELGKCSRIWEMPLDGLSLNLDVSLIRGRVKDLIKYLENRLKKSKNYNRMKLMVVGYAGRGKTSLLQALRLKRYPPEKPAVTVGVTVNDWRYERRKNGKRMKYTLSTWDFAGQEDFYSSHQCFLSNRTLYLVVCNISLGINEVDKMKPWLYSIQARAPGCPVIVVGTHYDQIPEGKREAVVAEFKKRLSLLQNTPGFPAIVDFAAVSLTKDVHKLKHLRAVIKDTVDEFKIKGQPVMGQKVPASYVKLGDILYEECKKMQSFPVMTHLQLVDLIKAKNLDLDINDELMQAVNFLHETGFLLHYNETTLQMKNYYFINPGWLCRMMAQVITVPEINPFIDANGVMKKSRAQMLFMDKEMSGQSNFNFSSVLIPQYLHLLEKFEIALPRNEEELLIPCRLPDSKPDIKLPEFEDRTELVKRIYAMPYTPFDFWSRLLTRLIVFSEKMLSFQKKPQVQVWKKGLVITWSQTAFFSVTSYEDIHSEIHFTVPGTAQGYRLIGCLVDQTDSMVNEWYPGLITIDLVQGRELLEKLVPCCGCDGDSPYRFRFEELLTASETRTEIFCPQHSSMVDLVKLAPDVMLADVEPQFHLDHEQLSFKKNREHLCGNGGFGSVYKATYKQQVVAVKVFSGVGDVHPHTFLRHEAALLRRLNHPSIIALVGVSLRPVPLVVIEFAPRGSLSDVFMSGLQLSRSLQLKISQQVSEGLAYLHGLDVIYRDLKPDNVLVFSLIAESVVNVKIADYGISQFSTFSLRAQEGTKGYRSPEVIRGETYTSKADIFSLGLLMFMIRTGGVHPFHENELEIDEAIAENWRIPPLTGRCPPWHDFHQLVIQCLSHIPDDRPKAQEVFDMLVSAEFFSLREMLFMSVGTPVTCMAVQKTDNTNILVCAASGEGVHKELSTFNLLEYEDNIPHSKRMTQSNDYGGIGTIFSSGRIQCLQPISNEHILLGTDMGKIHVFNATTNSLCHSTRQLQGSILSLCIVQRQDNDPLILAGLSNGTLALYPLSEILQEPGLEPLEMKLGKVHEPVHCLVRSERKHCLIASCGTRVVVLATWAGIAVKNIFDTVEKRKRSSSPITCMACGLHQLYLTHSRSQVLEAWDITLNIKQSSLNIINRFKLPEHDTYVTSMLLHELKTLWLGTDRGHLLLLDISSLTPIITIHRHTGPVTSLLSVRLAGTSRSDLSSSACFVLSGSFGYRNSSASALENANQLGSIGVWDVDIPQVVKQLSDWSKKRTAYSKSRNT